MNAHSNAGIHESRSSQTGVTTMLAQIQDNTHKAYVALQSYVTSPANIPIPGIVRTDRQRLTREQMAARYLKSVEGNPNIDINKARAQDQQKVPKMVEKSMNPSVKNQWPSLANDHLSDELKSAQTSRNLLETKVCVPYPDLDQYQKKAREIKELEYETSLYVDDVSVCMSEIPEFIVCSNRYLHLTQWSLFGYPAQILLYRSVPNDGYPPTDPLPLSKTSADINAEIHETLQNNKATRIYLSQEQLDSYLNWRLSQGSGLNFPYIRVDDESKVDTRNVAIGLGIIGGIGACALAGVGIDAIRRRKAKVEAEVKKQEAKIPAAAIQQKEREKDTSTGIADTTVKNADDKKILPR
jgi:hypothetical protein